MRIFAPLFFSYILLSFTTSICAQPYDDSPKALYQYAFSYFEHNRLSLALDHLDKAIAKESNFVEAYILRAKVKKNMGDISGALTDYSIVLHIDPQLTEARFDRGRLYYQTKRFKDALADFHLLLQLPPSETTTVYFIGKSDATGFNANGITTLQSNILADIYNYIGLAHLSLKNPDSAAFYIHQAIESKPSEPDFYVNRGLIQEEKKDTLSAIKMYQKALSFQADHAVALSNLAKLSKEKEYAELVSQSYDFAVEDQGTYQSYFNRGIMRQSIGKHRLAIEDFDKALELAGNNDEIFLMRAYSKEFSSDLNGAIQDYSWALKLNPSLEKAFTNRGNVYYKQKQYEKAVQDFNKAIHLNPENAKLYYNRGLALYLAGNTEKACKDLQKALNMDFTSAIAPIEAYCISP